MQLNSTDGKIVSMWTSCSFWSLSQGSPSFCSVCMKTVPVEEQTYLAAFHNVHPLSFHLMECRSCTHGLGSFRYSYGSQLLTSRSGLQMMSFCSYLLCIKIWKSLSDCFWFTLPFVVVFFVAFFDFLAIDADFSSSL